VLSRRQILWLAGVVIVISAAAIVLPRFLARPKDIKSALADALHVPHERKDDFFINLPPADSRYPGAILAGNKLLVLQPSTANDRGFLTGQHFSLTADDSTVADAAGSLDSDLIRSAAKDRENVSLELVIDDGTVIELPVPELKRLLLESESAKSAANKGVDPLIVDRAYVGTLTFVLKRKSDAGAKLVSDIAKSGALASSTVAKLDATRAAEGELKVTISDPIVFAFEVSAASYITNNLSIAPTDVNFRRVRPADLSGLPSTPASSSRPDVPWTLGTISSGYFPAMQTLTQTWNASSADLVENTLTYFHPSSHLELRSTKDAPLTRKILDEFLTDLAAMSSRNQSRFIVLYYVGHTVSWPNGDIAIVLGDATAIPNLERPGSKDAVTQQLGSNIGDLMQLADTLTANLEQLPPGYLPLREVYAELEKTRLPFLLAIDGCLRNDDFEKFRASLGIIGDQNSGSFFFVDANQQLASSLSAFDVHLRHFADGLPYLHSENPVILAAKPGTFALPGDNPDISWTAAGPLAWRMTQYVRSSLLVPSPPNLADVFSNITDYAGTGEITPKGSISWSDFTLFRRVAGAARL